MDRLEEVTITEYDDFLHNYPAQNTKVDYHNPGDRVCVYDFTGWKEGDRLNDYLIAMRNKDDTHFWIRRTPKYVGHMSPILPTNFVIPERYQEFVEYENTMLNWLDGQIRQSVAQEIFKDLNKYRFAEPQYIAEAGREPVIICLTENDMLAIKSKWGIE